MSSEKRPPTSWLLAYLQERELLSKASPQSFLSVLGTASSEGSEGDNFVELTDGVALSNIPPEVYEDYGKSCHLVARQLNILPGESALIVNGRVSTP